MSTLTKIKGNTSRKKGVCGSDSYLNKKKQNYILHIFSVLFCLLVFTLIKLTFPYKYKPDSVVHAEICSATLQTCWAHFIVQVDYIPYWLLPLGYWHILLHKQLFVKHASNSGSMPIMVRFLPQTQTRQTLYLKTYLNQNQVFMSRVCHSLVA